MFHLFFLLISFRSANDPYDGLPSPSLPMESFAMPEERFFSAAPAATKGGHAQMTAPVGHKNPLNSAGTRPLLCFFARHHPHERHYSLCLPFCYPYLHGRMRSPAAFCLYVVAVVPPSMAAHPTSPVHAAAASSSSSSSSASSGGLLSFRPGTVHRVHLCLHIRESFARREPTRRSKPLPNFFRLAIF